MEPLSADHLRIRATMDISAPMMHEDVPSTTGSDETNSTEGRSNVMAYGNPDETSRKAGGNVISSSGPSSIYEWGHYVLNVHGDRQGLQLAFGCYKHLQLCSARLLQ